MNRFFYDRGRAKANSDAGVKLASKPEMGDALYETISAATGVDGRVRGRSLQDPQDQADTAFSEHDRHMRRDPHNDAHVLPVGMWQSKGAASYEAVAETSPVPVHPHATAKHVGAGFVNRDYQDITAPAIIVDTDNLNPNFLAHEIGHAQFEESPVGQIIQHPVSRSARLLAPLAGYAAGRYAPTTKSKVIGTAAALGLTAPTLISEGVADYKGYEHLKNLGATPEELDQYLRDLLPGQASYLAIPAATAGFGLLGKGMSTLSSGGLPRVFSKAAAAHKLQGRRKFRNLNISIENRKGSVRKWYDPHEDREGRTIQHYPYGYIRMTEGMDGDHVDCYVGPNEQAKNVYVITTNKPPRFTQIDEQKCMLGFDSAKEARRVFHMHYDKPQFFHSMKAIPYEDFERKVLATRMSPQKKIASPLKKLAVVRSELKGFRRAMELMHSKPLIHGTPAAKSITESGVIKGSKDSIHPGVHFSKGQALAGYGDTHFAVPKSNVVQQAEEAGVKFVEDHPFASPASALHGDYTLRPKDTIIASAAKLKELEPGIRKNRLRRVLSMDRSFAERVLNSNNPHKLIRREFPQKPHVRPPSKTASNRYESDDLRPLGSGPGPTHNQVPGDFLGLPHSSLVGMRSIKGGNPEDPGDTIDRMFRFHDEPMNSRVLEGNTAALPESPGV